VNRAVRVLIFSAGIVMFSSLSFCESLLLLDSRIPDKTWFMIGDIIYEAGLEAQNSLEGSYQVSYRYIGFSDNAIRIRYEYTANDDFSKPHMPVETYTIVVPLDEEEKGYLSVPAFPKRPAKAKVLPIKLVIGIYDRQKALITVNEYGTKHISQRRASASYKKPGSRSSSHIQGLYEK